MTQLKPQAKNHETETDEVLGALPTGWTSAKTETDRILYINHNLQTTTWIDPRTKKVRKTDITLISEGELPFGWDELYDVNFGYFYADHNTMTNYELPPWTPETREKYFERRKELGKGAKAVAAQAVNEFIKRTKSKESLFADEDAAFNKDLNRMKAQMADINNLKDDLIQMQVIRSNNDKRELDITEAYEAISNKNHIQTMSALDYINNLSSEISPGSSSVQIVHPRLKQVGKISNEGAGSRPQSLVDEMKLRQQQKKNSQPKPMDNSVDDEKDAEDARLTEEKLRHVEDEHLSAMHKEEKEAKSQHEEIAMMLFRCRRKNDDEGSNEEIKSLENQLEKARLRMEEIINMREKKEFQMMQDRKTRESIMLVELAKKKQERAEILLRKLEEAKQQQKAAVSSATTSAPFASDAERKRQAVSEAMKRKEEEAKIEASRREKEEETEIERRRQVLLKQKEAEKEERLKKVESYREKYTQLEKQRNEVEDSIDLMNLELEMLVMKKMISQEQRAIYRIQVKKGPFDGNTRERAGSSANDPAFAPEWVKKASSILGGNGSSPKSIRIKKVVDPNPDRLTFAEKMHIFIPSSGQDESDETAPATLDDALQNA